MLKIHQNCKIDVLHKNTTDFLEAQGRERHSNKEFLLGEEPANEKKREKTGPMDLTRGPFSVY